VWPVPESCDEAPGNAVGRAVAPPAGLGQIPGMTNLPQLPDLPETSLDPHDWSAMRAAGHAALDEMLDWLMTLRDRPAWQPMPEEAFAEFRQPIPRGAEGLDSALVDFRRAVLPYPIGNVHPRFWGWVQGTGTAGGLVAEILKAGMNVNAWGGQHAAPYLEAQVLDWCKEMLGFPEAASGVLVSGGSIANLVGLQVARDAMGGRDVGARGLHELGQQLVIYASTETHNSVDRAARTLGLGGTGLRHVPVDTEFQMDLRALAEAVAADRAVGRRPICVVGNAGTVNTGATDDLDALADFCAREELWFHVDGAFGALAALSPALAPLVRGMGRADSIAFDLHKWLYMPYNVGCTLVRDPALHRQAFTPGAASYLTALDRGAAAGPHNYSHLGPELSREFRALTVWMSLKEHGVDRYARQIEQNVAQARALGAMVEAEPELELLALVALNVVCFRYRVPQAGIERANAINREILMRVQERGVAVPSSTVLRGVFAIRVANTNHRSRREDFAALVAAVLEEGRRLTAPA